MKRLFDHLRIDKDSYGTILFSWVVCAVLIWLTAHCIHNLWVSIPISALFVIFMLFITWFFRVPDRMVPEYGNKRLVTSVADGKVVIAEKVFEKEFLQRDCIQISVYMDFFDVHCNFWPMDGKVIYYKYHPGKYFLAFHPKSSELNEHASSCLQNAYGEVFFKQIAGTFARRIVCYSRPGSMENRGEQCGVIKFGSRIDMFLPLDADIRVKVGDKVRAVESVIAVLPEK
ncbi:MAG: phosphatidylserine decarboxylase family protein [Bacteroidales bacterium]|jgi:phosphatidylserine decarboxylase|nr:phosphatidylserine decarboxylase family protein [Bacteroidales bacterium]